MKTALILTFCTLALVNTSCTDKDRLLAVVQNGTELPNQRNAPIYLYQNYPNPFNPSTVINFDNATAAMHIRLRVMTEDWVEVKTLVDTVLNYGRYNVVWDAGNLPSGEYLAVLEGGGVTEAIRMRLIK